MTHPEGEKKSADMSGGEDVVITTEPEREENTALQTVSAPFTATWRVLQNDRIPAYLVGGGLIVMGVIDPPVVVGGLIVYEALRRISVSSGGE